ncbi:MAG: hypothetical protein GXP25_11665 [Planctomycetes bacterium]|nr:hypothetical protein [Planctomycetota bacterium]
MVLTQIPSEVAGNTGLALGIVLPKKARYKAGAPVVINVPGGHGAGGVFSRGNFPDFGFVTISFCFPGGGRGRLKSGGTYDYRGADSIHALRDVIRFAMGKSKDKSGRTIHDIAKEKNVTVLTSNVGLFGGSHGGNACGAAMGIYGQELPGLAFYVSMESPYGAGAVGVEVGDRRSGKMNPAYNPKTGKLDLSKLAFDPELRLQAMGRQRGPVLQGGLFFDMDGDGKFSPDKDFQHRGLLFDLGNGPKAWYSIRLIAEAERRDLYGGHRPAHIPTLKEAKEFWRYRNAAPLIPDIVKKIPNLAVIVIANQKDHVQIAPDHFHILAQVNGFQKAGAKFIRVNCDRAYAEWALGRKDSRIVDNPANVAYTGQSIQKALQANDLDRSRMLSSAAVCEVADRVQAGNFQPDLETVLFPSAPKASAPAFDRPRTPRRRFGSGNQRDGER